MDVCPSFYSTQIIFGVIFGEQQLTHLESLQDKVVIRHASLCCLPLLRLRGPAVRLLSLRLQVIALLTFLTPSQVFSLLLICIPRTVDILVPLSATYGLFSKAPQSRFSSPPSTVSYCFVVRKDHKLPQCLKCHLPSPLALHAHN